MPNMEPAEVPRRTQIAKSVGFDDDAIDFLESLNDHADNDGGYADFDAALVYAAARIRGLPVKPREVVRDIDGVDTDDLVRDMRRLVDPLPFDPSVEDPSAFVDRYVDEVAPDNERLRETARSLCAAATDAGIHSGKAPSGFAAAVVYAASEVVGAGIRQSDVCDVADVTAATVRKQYRDVIAASDEVSMTPGPEDIPDLVDRIADAIGRVPDAVTAEAGAIADAIVANRPPFVTRTKAEGVAAGAFYVAAERNRFDVSMKEVAGVIGVSKHTVVVRSKDVRAFVDEHGVDTGPDAGDFDDVPYNDLKRLAADAGVTPGPQPSRDDLVEALVDAGVDP